MDDDGDPSDDGPDLRVLVSRWNREVRENDAEDKRRRPRDRPPTISLRSDTAASWRAWVPEASLGKERHNTTMAPATTMTTTAADDDTKGSFPRPWEEGDQFIFLRSASLDMWLDINIIEVVLRRQTAHVACLHKSIRKVSLPLLVLIQLDGVVDNIENIRNDTLEEFLQIVADVAVLQDRRYTEARTEQAKLLRNGLDNTARLMLRAVGCDVEVVPRQRPDFLTNPLRRQYVDGVHIR